MQIILDQLPQNKIGLELIGYFLVQFFGLEKTKTYFFHHFYFYFRTV